MYGFFYSFHNKPLAYDLFTQETEDGTPAPPVSMQRITDNGITRITDDGQIRITE